MALKLLRKRAADIVTPQVICHPSASSLLVAFILAGWQSSGNLWIPKRQAIAMLDFVT